ncbi:hypothetical protein FRC09_018085 [Ceratobasidium sp. 395]|nr:hypothetical protein FRC09_018085 [Ceratobasidium sp. 395]
MSIPPSPINSIFQSWKAAHDQLVNSITAYATACTHLQSTLAFTRQSYHDSHDFFDASLLEVEKKIPEFEGYKQILDDSVHNLQKARNLSFSLAPINMLPQSLLLRIFAMLIDSGSIKETSLPLPRQMQRHPTLILSSIRSLDTVLQDVYSLTSVLALWPVGSLAPSLKTLSVKILLSVFCSDEPVPQVLPDGSHDKFLQSLTSFSLCGGCFDWGSWHS